MREWDALYWWEAIHSLGGYGHSKWQDTCEPSSDIPEVIRYIDRVQKPMSVMFCVGCPLSHEQIFFFCPSGDKN